MDGGVVGYGEIFIGVKLFFEVKVVDGVGWCIKV